MAALGAAAEDLFNIGPEADVEHAISLVERDDFERAEIERATAHVVEHPAGRADDDRRVLGEFVDLTFDRFPAIDGDAPQRRPGRQLLELVPHLHRQFPGRHQHQCPHSLVAAGAGREQFEDRQDKRCRLSRAGPSLSQHIDAGNGPRDQAGLYWCWLAVASLMNRCKAGRGEAEPIEAGAVSGGRRRRWGRLAAVGRFFKVAPAIVRAGGWSTASLGGPPPAATPRLFFRGHSIPSIVDWRLSRSQRQS